LNAIGRSATFVVAVAVLSGTVSAQVQGDGKGQRPDPGANAFPREETPPVNDGESRHPSLLERGRDSFNSSCTDCHDAERSLGETKSFAGWMQTIRIMAAKEDADIPADRFEAIAVFLTAEAKADEATADEEKADDENVDEEQDQEPQEDSDANARQPDQALIERGRNTFSSSCTQCHDAQRSLSKQKSYSGWMQTIRRMAAMDGAQIPRSSFRAIATYLSSQNASGGDGGAAESGDEGEEGAAAENVSP